MIDMSNPKFAILGFFALVVGLVLIFNSGSFIKSISDTCGFNGQVTMLIFNMLYEICTGLLILGGAAALLTNISGINFISNAFTTIIVVSLIVLLLFGLGSFSAGVFSPARLWTTCIAQPGYLCTNLRLDNQVPSQLSFVLGHDTGSPVYNIELSCASTTKSNGAPYTGTANPFSVINSSGAGSNNYDILGTSDALSLTPGYTTTLITNLTCYYATGKPVGYAKSEQIGNLYCGSIWMNYTTTPSPPFNWITTKIATVRTRVT